MAATTAQVREALRDTLADGIDGWQVSAYMLALPQPPTIDIRPGAKRFDLAMARGLDEALFIVRGMVAFNADIGAQVKLDTLLDSTTAGSVKVVLEADKTLGGLVQDLRVTEHTPYQALLLEGQPAILGVEFTVQVLL